MTSTTDPRRTAVHIDRDDCLQLEKCLTREWLETNGRNGYASSTALMCPTRRYHGLLVAVPPGRTKRHVFVSRFDETLHGDGKTFPISMARYPGLWSPLGHQLIEHFELVPYPSTLYRIGPATVRREVMMVQGRQTVLVRYHVAGLDDEIELRLRPLLACREADALTYENMDLSTRVTRLTGGVSSQPYASLPAVTMTVGGTAQRFEADPVWYRQLEYQVDIARGYDGHEDQFSPGLFHLPLAGDGEVVVACTIEDAIDDPVALWNEEAARRGPALDADAGVREQLAASADDFLYRDENDRLGVVAGWPWFVEWGRDTFISLPGLTLARGRVAECGDALTGVLPYIDRGLVPNIYGAGKHDSHYGSVDAALWFARCVRLYELAGGGRERVLDAFRPALTEIARSYRDGTGLEIRCDDGGLIEAGSESLNATWMDARTEDGPVTPRAGFAVEINALWYFLLEYLEKLGEAAGDAAATREWGSLRARAGESFLERFWLPDGRYLADCWQDGVADTSVRPNMVIAAALELSPLSRGKRTDIVAQAEVELLTPRGLRTLAPESPDYEGHYRGTQKERDDAYHQGTVWPWLLGFYCEAWLRAHGRGERQDAAVRELLDGFAEHLPTYGLGHVSEVFDGDPPHRPGGTIAQAWSSAELLRAYALLEEQPA